MSFRVAEAMAQLAQRLGMGRVDPIVLHESQHVSVRLFPFDVVARAVHASNFEAVNRLALEIEIAHHLVKNEAPVVGPSARWPAGPHIQGDFVVTLWEFVAHVAADEDNADHVSGAADALRRVHLALGEYRGDLPDFWLKVDRCRDILENEQATPALRPLDRDFLGLTLERLRGMARTIPTNTVPIHGDAHLGNVFITPNGARWNDLEDVCLGPREWDVCWLPKAGLVAFEPMNRELFSVLHYLRSLCVSVWCWEKYDVPAKREAADYHLEYLRAEFDIGRRHRN